MDKEIGVIVGTGLSGQKNIAAALENEGISVESSGQMWPRDNYVYFKDRYVKNGSLGSMNGNAFGEGGKVLTGDDFLLIADSAFIHDQITDRLSEKPTHEERLQAIVEEGKVQHPDARIYVAPTGYFHGGKGDAHIDMFSLLLPKRKILLLDTHYGKAAGKAGEYDEIAEAESLELIRYDGSQDGVWYPLNSLVLSQNGNDVVIVDDNAKSLIKLLQNEGVKSIGVEIPQNTYPAGKIRCQTNTFNIADDPNTLLEK